MGLVAVAAHLALYKFTLKTSPPSAFSPELTESLPVSIKFDSSSESGDWDTGVVYAKAQNLARTVSQMILRSCVVHSLLMQSPTDSSWSCPQI